MIPQSAVKEFLNRPLRDLREWKKLTNTQIETKCDALPIHPPIWRKLHKHQKICFLVGAGSGHTSFFLDTGCGKTLLSIALIKYFAKLKHNKRVLVLVPNISNKSEWGLEIEKHSPITKYLILEGSSKDKWEHLEDSDALIVIETYAGLMKMVTTKVKAKRSKKFKLQPDKTLIKKLLQKIDGLVMDESTLASTRGKLPFRICRQIAKKASIRFALAGMPFGRDPTPLWGQMYLIDQGETLGKTLGLFRAAFFKSKDNYWGGTDYTFDQRKMGLLHRTISHSAIRFKAREADLPRVVPITKNIVLPESTSAYFEKAKKALVDAKGDFSMMNNAFLRMRQISSGWIGYKDDTEGRKAEFEFADNPKLEAMLETIDTIDPADKILIFHDFVFSGSIIARELDARKIKYVRLWHGTKDVKAIRKQFDEDPDTRIFILNSAGAFGLNLQVAKYALTFERLVSVIMYTQIRRRIERQFSQHDRIFIYDFVTKNTMDERIIRFHSEGKALFDGIVEGKAGLSFVKQMGLLE